MIDDDWGFGSRMRKFQYVHLLPPIVLGESIRIKSQGGEHPLVRVWEACGEGALEETWGESHATAE